KYKKIRIDISDNLNKCISDYIAGRKDDEYMFPSRKGGTPIKRQTVWLILNEAAKEAGITENIGTHSMRKTFGYWHYQQNHDIRLLMEIFQHSSEDVTLRYIGVNAERMKDSLRNMNLGL
ncbi:MAG: tyrosine-type recombinase/integrase, partial [Lachnospiraceae bacterium]|nr:tyrosine-type recombinase/integrase [Lachnospiraceae bacterium]